MHAPIYTHIRYVCIYTHTYTTYAHHTHRHHIHTSCTCNIHKHHTTHQAQRLKQQTSSPYTLPPCHIHTVPHTHHTHMHTTPRKTMPTHTQMLQHTHKDHVSHPQVHNITLIHTHHTLSTNMQTPDTFPPPHPATPTLTHSYNTHITKTTATHPHTFPFSLSCSRSWRELCQLRRRDSTSRACFYKHEVPHQLWPPP